MKMVYRNVRKWSGLNNFIPSFFTLHPANMKTNHFIALLAAVICSCSAMAQTPSSSKMNTFITSLMNKMTLDEKIGQLNLPSVGFDVTGPILSQGVEGKLEKGLVGGVFNTYTPSAMRK